MNNIKVILTLLVVALIMLACTTPEPSPETHDEQGNVQPTHTPPDIGELESDSTPISPTATITTTIVPSPAIIPTETAAAVPTETRRPTESPPTETAAPTIIASPSAGSGISVAHRDIERFHEIPDEYIAAASQISWLFRHASVGVNIQNGLNCLMNNFERRPSHCDRDLSPGEIIYNAKYDHRNWQFEFHSPPPGQNPGWWNKVNFFIDRMNNLAPGEQYDYASFKMGYVDAHQGSNISLFFVAGADANLPDYQDIEALQTELGDTEIIWWTLGLARLSFTESQEFNEQLRAYVAAKDGILMDIADIMSHDPQGERCFDNAGNGIIALCPIYTNEIHGGHLNARGSARMAQAIWILMARLAGWNG